MGSQLERSPLGVDPAIEYQRIYRMTWLMAWQVFRDDTNKDMTERFCVVDEMAQALAADYVLLADAMAGERKISAAGYF